MMQNPTTVERLDKPSAYYLGKVRSLMPGGCFVACSSVH